MPGRYNMYRRDFLHHIQWQDLTECQIFSNKFRLKGTVSPDIGLHFRFWKINLVLSAGPFIDLTFSYFVVPAILKKWYFKLLLWKHLVIVETLPKAVPESMFRLTDLAVRLRMGFSKPDMTVNIHPAPSAANRKDFHIHNQLTENRETSLYRVSVRISVISECFHRSSFEMYV